MSPKERMAMALASYKPDLKNPMAGNPAVADVPLELPPEMKALEALSTVGAGYGVGQMGGQIARVLAGKGVPALRSLGEAGALFPEEDLPVFSPGTKVGEPHALYAYHDDFGPGMTKRAIYNIFGDPENPILKKAGGFGSSVPKEILEQHGIPIKGREPPRAFLRKAFK